MQLLQNKYNATSKYLKEPNKMIVSNILEISDTPNNQWLR